MTRVFISYARGDDAAFAQRLCADLKAQGFTVWFDRESLMSRGVTFHQEIKDAIRTEVDRIIYVGGPQASLSAYVREEWQFALQCDQVVVVPILRLGDYDTIPGELSLLHCEDFRDDAKYPATFAKLVASLGQPNPKLGALFAVPDLPAHFLGRPELMRRVRDALLVDLQRPHVITSADAKVGMQGMGGIGKSVLAAALARNREVRQCYPDGVVWVSCGQHLSDDDLLARLRDLAKHLGGDTAFNSLPQGQGVLRALLQAKSVLLVLDDVWHAKDGQVFDVLGPRCRMLVTTRDKGILDALHGELVPVSLFTENEALQLLADAVGVGPAALSADATAVVRECGCLPLALALSGGMARKHGGNFRSVLERLRRAELDKIADRETINAQHRSIWRAMQASVEMLTEDEQKRYIELVVFDTAGTVPEAAAATLWEHTGKLDPLDTEDLLVNLSERSLIQLDQQAGAAGRMLRRFRLHDLLHDFVARAAGDLQARHNDLLAAYRRKCPDGWHTGPHDGYFVEKLCEHLIMGGRLDELVKVHLDLRWLEVKQAAGRIFDLPVDYAETIRLLPADHPQHHILRCLEVALRRDINFIARHASDYPQALFQCLWNSCWWHDCPEAAHHAELATGPWNDPGAKLCDLLQSWRTQKEASTPGFHWLRSVSAPQTELSSSQAAVLRGHADKITCVAFSPDGRRVVSGSADSTVRVWDVATSDALAVLGGHEQGIKCVAFAADGRRIVSGSEDKTARVWDVISQTELLVLRGHREAVTGVAFSSDGRHIVSCSADQTMRVWDASSGRELRSLGVDSGRRQCAGITTNGPHIISVALDGRVQEWNIPGGQEIRCVKLAKDRRGLVITAISPDQQRILGAGYGTVVQEWNAVTGESLPPYSGHSQLVTCVAYAPKGDVVASGSADRTVRVWDAATRRQIQCLAGHEARVLDIAFSPDGRLIVSGSDDKTVRLWHAARPQAAHATEAGTGIGSDSQTPAIGRATEDQGDDADRDYTKCDAGVDRETVRLAFFELLAAQIFHAVCFTPSGRRVALASCNGTVTQWDVLSGRKLNCFHGVANNPVLSIAYSADEQRVAGASLSGSLWVWDAASGAELGRLSGKRAVETVAFSTDGKSISYGCSADGKLLMWDFATGNCWEADQVKDAGTPTPAAPLPFCARACGLETVIADAVSEQPLGWFPDALCLVIPHPSGRIWAGLVFNVDDVVIIRLEGQLKQALPNCRFWR